MSKIRTILFVIFAIYLTVLLLGSAYNVIVFGNLRWLPYWFLLFFAIFVVFLFKLAKRVF